MPALSFLRAFFYSQLLVTPPKQTHDFSNQTIIVTGANIGLGLEAARQFAKLNCARLILAVRTLSKGQDAKASILQSTGRTEDFIEVWELDMSRTASVLAFAQRAKHELPRIDVLLLNAGIALQHWAEMEGMEQNIKVNVISTCLLTFLMLPHLRQAAQQYSTVPRVVIVSSEAHKVTQYKEFRNEDIFATLAEKEYFEKHNTERYPISKLMEILFVRELVKHIDDRVLVTTVTPGLCHSELANRTPSRVDYWGAQVMKFLLARRTDVGARTLVAGACAGPESHGGYMEDCAVVEPDIWVAEGERAEMQRRTYEQIVAYLEGIVPGVKEKI